TRVDELRGVQKRACDVAHEVTWFHWFRSLLSSEEEKVRALDNLGKLGRAWLQAIPTSPLTTLSDAEVRYGVRNVLMIRSGGGGGVCAWCGGANHEMHHLSCRRTSALRTMRHTAIKEAIIDTVGRMTGLTVHREVFITR